MGPGARYYREGEVLRTFWVRRAAEGQTWLVDLLLRLYEGRAKPREAKEVSLGP